MDNEGRMGAIDVTLVVKAFKGFPLLSSRLAPELERGEARANMPRASACAEPPRGLKSAVRLCVST